MSILTSELIEDFEKALHDEINPYRNDPKIVKGITQDLKVIFIILYNQLTKQL
jgi:hypothetical protein